MWLGITDPFPRCAFQSCSTLQIIGERRLRGGSSSAFIKAGRVATRFHSFITAGWKSARGKRETAQEARDEMCEQHDRRYKRHSTTKSDISKVYKSHWGEMWGYGGLQWCGEEVVGVRRWEWEGAKKTKMMDKWREIEVWWGKNEWEVQTKNWMWQEFSFPICS